LKFLGGAPVSLARNSAAAESEGGQKFLPPNPLPFCPPERLVCGARSAPSVLFKKGSDFVKQTHKLEEQTKVCFLLYL
jgi:hypothetical protein